MIFQKTEWYMLILAAFTLSLIYYVAFDKNIGALAGAGGSLLGKVMGQTPGGTFQAPF